MTLFILDIVVLVVFAIASLLAYAGFSLTRERLALYQGLLTSCFLLDHFLIFAAQFLFNPYPNVNPESGLISAPALKIALLVLRQLAYLLVARELFGLSYPKWLYGIFPLLFLLYWNIYARISASDDLLPAWIFYEVMQAYLLVLVIVCSRTTAAHEKPELRKLLLVTSVLLICTVAFDLIWLFDLEELNPFAPFFEEAVESNPFETALHVLFSVLIARQVIRHVVKQMQHGQSADEPHSTAEIDAVAQDLHLTKREEEVFRLLLEDFSYQEICDKLVVSMSTVKSHAHNIYDKAGCSRRSDLRRLVSRGGDR